jgi:hypothetical protein
MSEWQPIETAPKAKPNRSGPSILVWDGRAIGIAQWCNGSWRYQAGPDDAAYSDFDPDPICKNPTHWMPLPEPPAE